MGGVGISGYVRVGLVGRGSGEGGRGGIGHRGSVAVFLLEFRITDFCRALDPVTGVDEGSSPPQGFGLFAQL